MVISTASSSTSWSCSASVASAPKQTTSSWVSVDGVDECACARECEHALARTRTRVAVIATFPRLVRSH